MPLFHGRSVAAKLTSDETGLHYPRMSGRQIDQLGMQIRRLLLIAATVVTVGVSGCGNSPTKSGVPWWPQGPGNADEVITDQDRSAVPEQSADDTKVSESARTVSPEPANSMSSESIAAAAGEPGAPTAAQFSVVPSSARYGDLLFVSGQIRDNKIGEQGESASIADETRSVMEKIRSILEAERLTMTNIVSTTIFVTNLDDWSAVELAYNAYFPSVRPASSIMEVRRLPGNARIQIGVVAGR